MKISTQIDASIGLARSDATAGCLAAMAAARDALPSAGGMPDQPAPASSSGGRATRSGSRGAAAPSGSSASHRRRPDSSAALPLPCTVPIPLLSLPFEAAIESLGSEYWDVVEAASFPRTTLRVRNDALLHQLGLSPASVQDAHLEEAYGCFAGRHPAGPAALEPARDPDPASDRDAVGGDRSARRLATAAALAVRSATSGQPCDGAPGPGLTALPLGGRQAGRLGRQRQHPPTARRSRVWSYSLAARAHLHPFPSMR